MSKRMAKIENQIKKLQDLKRKTELHEQLMRVDVDTRKTLKKMGFALI